MPNPGASSAADREIAEIIGSLSAITALDTADDNSLAQPETLEHFAEQVISLGVIAGANDQRNLQAICMLLKRDIGRLCAQEDPVTHEQMRWLAAWPELLKTYIESPDDPQSRLALVEHLRRPGGCEQDISALQRVLMPEAADPRQLGQGEISAATPALTDPAEPSAIGPLPDVPEDACDERDGDEQAMGSLLAEVGAMAESLQGLGEASDPAKGEAEARRQALQRFAEQLEGLANAAAAAQLIGLQQACVLLQEGLQEWAVRENPLSAQELALLEQWPMLFVAYVESPEEQEAGEGLLEFLRDPAWGTSMSAEELALLQELLASHCVQQAVSETDSAHDRRAATHSQATTDSAEALPLFADANRSATEDVQALEPEEQTRCSRVELDEGAQELVDLLRAELAEIIEAREELVAPIVAEGSEPAARRQALEHYAEQAEHIANAAEMVGLAGLHQGVAHIHHNLLVLGEQDPGAIVGARPLLEGWPVFVLGYLQTLHDRRASEALVKALQDPQWPTPLQDSQAPALLDLLATPSVATEDEAVPRQQQAVPEDVSLELAEDVNQELLDSLLRELPAQTEEFSAAIQRLLGGGFISDVEVAQRIAHTLKGAGNVVGVRGIANLTHQLEDILQALSKHETLPPPALADTLMSAADCLEAMSEALLGVGAPPEDAVDVLQDVLDWANLIDREGVPRGEHSAVTASTPEQAHTNTATPRETVPAESAEAMLRIPASLVDNLLRLAGENIISTGQVQEQVRRTTSRIKTLESQNQLVRQLISELEHLVEIRGISSQFNRSAADGEFDALEMDQYNELHTVTHRLVEATTDSVELTKSVADRLVDLDAVTVHQERVHRENQEIVLRTRMVPVKTAIPRLQRSVRQAARITGKQVELAVSGAETLMDSEVLNDLMDPLMHMLRNAVDHGIELPEQRVVQGKDAKGSIALEFSRHGDRIVVRCRDDGKGLDYAAIRRVAEHRGLVTPDRVLSEDELGRLILVPGFSTRSEVTQVSGRGIGMDAVHARVLEMKGNLHIGSQTGKGSLVELSLPVTLLAAHALLVRIGGQIFALSNRGVEEILYPGAGELRKMGSETVYQVGDNVYEARTLNSLLKLADQRAQDRQAGSVLLIEEESGAKSAILVQEVLDSRDLVVKPLGQYVPNVRGVIGGAILGDGSVTLVLDLPELLHVPKVAAQASIAGKARVADTTSTLPCILVVDDSLSARRSLAQFVKDVGYEVRTARDGMEAVDIIQGMRPDIILADLEMPRMNGLELTSHVRAQEATRDIPVIMITSRSTEKHRQQAEKAGVSAYMTKPFSEDTLLRHIESALG